MKKICLVIGNLNCSGGTERVGSLIANELAKRGYHVTIISIEEGNRPYFTLKTEVEVIPLFPNSGRALYRTPIIINKIRSIIKSRGISTLIAVESIAVLFTLPAIYKLDVQHICWEHFNFKTDLGKSSRRIARQLAARYCDYIITLTDRDKKYWLQGTKALAKIRTIPNPSPFPPQNYIRNHENKLVIAVGRLNEQKGFDMLLQAWTTVIINEPKWKLVIIGEGSLRTTFEEFINDNNLSKSVSLVGNREDVSNYYKKADIFCLSSRYEGLPMVLLEAISFGLPIVSFDCDTGPAEILEGTGSILVPPNDVFSLAKSILLLMENPSKRHLISIQSNEKSKAYQTKSILDQWIEVIEDN